MNRLAQLQLFRVCLLLAACLLTLLPLDQSVAQVTPPGAQPSGPAVIPAELASAHVAIITIHGKIDKVTTLAVKRRLERAAAAGADAVVIELDTPGGELGAVLEICDLIEQSKVPKVFAWVNTQAYSGGAIIALACSKIFVNDTASFGDALPIAVSFGMLNALPEAERQKALVPLLAQVVYSARKNGYDEYLVQAIVSRNVELWLVQENKTGKRWCVDRAEYARIFGAEPTSSQPLLVAARTAGTAPAPAPSAPAGPTSPADPSAFRAASPQLQDLSGKVGASMKAEVAGRRPTFTAADQGKYTLIEYVCDGNGPIVMKAADMATLGMVHNGAAGPPATIDPALRTETDLAAFLGSKSMIRMDQRWSETAIGYMTSFPVRALLVVVFLVSLFVEATHPGVMLPGALAGLALLGLIAPPMLIGMANWIELVAILLGIAFLAIEIFLIPGFGIAGVLGLLLLVGGLIATFIPESSVFPDSPERQSETLYGLATFVLALVTSGVSMYYISKNFGSLPIANRLILKSPLPEESEGMLAAMEPSAAEGPLPGQVGIAITPLRPSGRVRVGESTYDVVAEMGYIAPGASVRVVSVSEFRIVVEPTPLTPPDQIA